MSNGDYCHYSVNYIVFVMETEYVLGEVGLELGYAVAQLVEALHYKPEGRGFDFRWGHWTLS